jgi:hypothetical protein
MAMPLTLPIGPRPRHDLGHRSLDTAPFVLEVKPVAKPVGLLEYLIETYTLPGAVVPRWRDGGRLDRDRGEHRASVSRHRERR